ncbi:MAG: hypothetical protein IJX17_06720 [Clostridia bacterium]|nr:hypothetical protein [Clostridia bacterium]
MAENLDWEKIMKEFDEGMMKAEIISNQVREERKNPDNYNLKEMADRVNKYLDEKKTAYKEVYEINKVGDDNE